MGFSVSRATCQGTPSRRNHDPSKFPNMYQCPSGYVFRMRVPNDLKPIVGKGEFRYSLRTGSLRVAKLRTRSIAAYIQELFLRLRSNMTELTQEQINQLVQRYIRETLSNDEQCRAIASSSTTGMTTLEGKSILESSDMSTEEAKSILTSVERWIRNQNHSLMEPVADTLIKSVSPDISQESVSYKVLSRELLKAFSGILKVRIKRSSGDYGQKDEELIPELKQRQQPFQATEHTSGPLHADKADNPSSNALRFSEVQDRYLVEVKKGGNWTEKTKEENLKIFELFVQIEGDLPVDKITRKLMSSYKDKLMRVPPNLNKLPEFKGMTIEEVIASNPEKTLAVNSINKYIRRMSGLFNYAVKNGYMLMNPAEGMQIKRSRRPDEERAPYTIEDLKKIFHSKEYVEGKHRHVYCHWTPLIALYTGCRLEEICQLYLEDIRQENGVWVFDINNNHEKKVKTLSSIRLVPIHPHLIDRGLLEYVESLKVKGEKRLFPELRQRRDGYGQTVSKWFQRYKKTCGIDDGKTFHSFRHTFITHLKHKQVDPFMIHELDGHAIDSETMGRYGKRFTPEILLREAIEKIDYGIDITLVNALS